MMNVSFDSLQKDDYNRKTIDYCKKYAESFDAMLKDGKGLLMWGNTGTGKSHAATAIANRVCELGFSAIRASFVEIIPDLVDATNSEDCSIIRDMIHADLVILDDFKPDLCTESVLENLYKIIDKRYQKKLPVIITTKITPHEMDKETGVSAKIYDRLLECCYLMQFTGPNRRITSGWRTPDELLARRFLEMTVPPEKLCEICRDYNIDADEGATYRDILLIAVLKRAQEGDEEAAKLVREFNLHN